MPPITTALIVANVVMFLLQSIAPGIVVPLALWPFAASASAIGASFGPWQLITYAFLHGGLVHLAFNMFALYMFGSAIEQVFGPRRYLIYYLVCVVSAALSQLLVASLMSDIYPTVGASGGVFGLLLAYGMYFPNNRVMLLFPPIPMPARVFVFVYAAIELYLGVTGTQAGVAHFAHLGGMIGGFIMLRYWRLSAAIRRRDPRL
ncbi:MAG: rhomboid family intramembrane serine protease [Pseudomonadota bacterium]|nr:rhomboid family intramembrane serine protease [Pseudomonadota bacterium]